MSQSVLHDFVFREHLVLGATVVAITGSCSSTSLRHCDAVSEVERGVCERFVRSEARAGNEVSHKSVVRLPFYTARREGETKQEQRVMQVQTGTH